MSPPSESPIVTGIPTTAVQLIPVAVQVFKGVQQLLRKQAPGDQYRILDYDATLELTGSRGKSAVFSKQEHVQFLQDDVQAIEDFAWGGGKVLVDYNCAPGVVVDRYQEGDRWKILISLREAKKRGEMETFYIQRRLVNVFTKREGWWQVEMRHQTDRIRLSIIFPRARHLHRAILVERTRNRTVTLDGKFWSDLPDGRRLLTWETNQPRRYEIYTFKWQW